MEYEIQSATTILIKMLTDFYHSPWVLAFKIFMGIYVLVLVIDIVLLLVLRGVGGDLRVGLKGMDMPTISKKKMKKRWEAIKLRLANGDSPQLKVAIIEADALADEILDGIVYKGANMREKLEQVGTKHLDDHLESLLGAHEIRNKIVKDPNYAIDQRMATAVIGVYENFLKYLEFLD